MPVKDTLQDETQMLQRGSVPVPDPTKLTTDAVQALRDNLTELFNIRFAHKEKEIAHLQALIAEKFEGIEEAFRGRDKALELSLTAQKEAAVKAESGFDRRIESMANLMNGQSKAMDDKIGDLKDRITAIESSRVGSGDTVKWIFAGLTALVAIITVIVFTQARPVPQLVIEKPATVTTPTPTPTP